MNGVAILARIRKICLALPEAHEKIAWGAPTFRVRDKQFAMFAANHHGDGRTALWCKAPPGAQEILVKADPQRFFVPPYVGPQGWLGIQLDKGLDWSVVAGLVRDGYLEVASKRLRELAAASAPAAANIAPHAAARCISAREPDMSRPRRPSPRRKVKPVTFETARAIALALPGVEEGLSYGTPAFRVRGKLIARLREDGGSLVVRIDMDEREALMAADPGTFYITDHYRGYPALLVRLSSVHAGDLESLLEGAWRRGASKRLVALREGRKG